MATKAVEAAKTALSKPSHASPSDLSHNPFQSLRSGYNVAVYIVKEVLGLDPVIVVNLSIIFAALSTFGRYITNYVWHYLQGLYMSSVRIHEDDSLYTYIMKWMTDKQLHTKRFRSVKAKLVQKTSIEDEEEALRLIAEEQRSVRLYKNNAPDQLISYRTMMSRNPIQLQPFEMGHWFIHKGQIFMFRHAMRTNTNPRTFKMTGELTIQCFGRSLEPIKKLLEEAQSYYLEKTVSKTAIFRAGGSTWGRISSRPSRDIDTIIMEKTKKQRLLQDINEYLHPKTRRWYSNHGIPYRRGYLFSGPPGTGKTSLTAALAGVFGLDIYVLSLLDSYLTEDSLVRLFSSLPSRCIVLLEDVDAAGLKRNDDAKAKLPTKVEPTDPALKPAPPVKPPLQISLSGLLNAIDGVAASEGRILIMTTNKPKELDAALIRPGRVDVHIPFTLPAREEMTEMFMSMYSGLEEFDRSSDPAFTLRTIKGDTTEKGRQADEELLEGLEPHSPKEPVSKEELEALAERFADELPSEQLSLAAVQGFLLHYKHDPRRAVEEAKSWSEETLKDLRDLAT